MRPMVFSYNGDSSPTRLLNRCNYLKVCLQVNFIMLLVWAFSAGTPVSKANWAKATLIFMLIGFVLVILFWGAIGGLLLSNM